MEALVAVGLAGNVVQFALCLGTLINEAKAIKKTGDTEDLPVIRRHTQLVVDQSVALKMRLNASRATLAEEDQVRILT